MRFRYITFTVASITFISLCLDVFEKSFDNISWLNAIHHILIFKLAVLLTVIALIIELQLVFKEFKEKIHKIDTNITTSTSTLTECNQQLNQLSEIYNTQIVGVIKEIEESSIWEMEGEIWGWNPNWALELGNLPGNKITKGLIEVHQRRITEDKVKKIKYFLLDGYMLRNMNGSLDSSDPLKFSKESFIAFLNKHMNVNAAFRKRVEDKYEIWEIPKERWQKVNSSSNGLIHGHVKPLKDFILIAGTKNNSNVGRIFLNHHLFYNGSGHSHYVELHKESPILNGFINNITSMEKFCSQEGIKPKKIKRDSNTYCIQ